MRNYKIAVAGTGYVGLSLGVLFAQHHQVVAVDIVQAKVDMINNKKSPIQDNHSQKLLSFRYNIDTNRVEARFTDGSAVANRMPNCLRTSSTRYFTVGLTRRIECHRFFMATAENHCNVFCVTNWSSE